MFCGVSPPSWMMTLHPATVGASSHPAQTGAGESVATAFAGGAAMVAGAAALAAGGWVGDAGASRRQPSSSTASAATEPTAICQGRSPVGAGGDDGAGGGAGHGGSAVS